MRYIENTQEQYDVYVYEPVPLDPGLEKHIISVFVADESGMINRVAGVFARRGTLHYTTGTDADLVGGWTR